MVIQQMLQLNPGCQAFFIVETNALAIQQVNKLQVETAASPPVQLLSGSTMDSAPAMLKSGVSIVVATAGGFEHAMTHGFLDLADICCLVLDEAHHCSKEHAYHKVIKGLFLEKRKSKSKRVKVDRRVGENLGNQSLSVSLPSPMMKIIALTASPAGEMTVGKTVTKIQKLLARLEADLVVPVERIAEVKERSPAASLDLVRVDPTPEERLLLGNLERLIVGRIASAAPVGSEVSTVAKALLHLPASTSAFDREPGSGLTLRFPDKEHRALLQRAFARTRKVNGGPHSCVSKQSSLILPLDGDVGSHEGSGGDSACVGGREDWNGALPVGQQSAFDHLMKLLNLSFLLDEVGGEYPWRWLRDTLVNDSLVWDQGEDGDEGKEIILGITEMLEEGLSHLPELEDEELENSDCQNIGEHSRRVVEGSKLKEVAKLLVDHHSRCKMEGLLFSALIFVSTRDLAERVPQMLLSIPELKPLICPTYIVGLQEMTLLEQQVALSKFSSGKSNVLVSTSVCGEGIDIKACGLVICTSLPKSGTELIQLRGRIRCRNKCQFVGLSRTCAGADQEQVRTLCLRESNMLLALDRIAASVSGVPRYAGTGMEVDAEIKLESGIVKARTSGSGAGAGPFIDRTIESCPKWISFVTEISQKALHNGCARSVLNEAIMVCSPLYKVEYNGWKVSGPPHLPTLGASCKVIESTHTKKRVVAEGRGIGSSLKFAKEKAAQHLVRFLMQNV
ncbi:unnamed protein product [Choristocarpus tenellus]